MSTDWNNYNQFMGAWARDEAKDDIESMIEEHNLFKLLTDFEYKDEVNKEFDDLVDMATIVEAEQITASTLSGAADAAAFAAMYSFGMGMAAFVIAEGLAIAASNAAASEQAKLTDKMKSADVDIANMIGSDSNVAKWIKKYKENNDMIASYCGKDQPTKEARNILFQFMAAIEARGVELTFETFHLYAESCRILWDSDTKDKVSDALDKLNFSSRSKQDVADCLKTLGFYTKLKIDAVKSIFLFTVVIYIRNAMKVNPGVLEEGMNLAVIGEDALGEDAIAAVGEGADVAVFVKTGCKMFMKGIAGIICVFDIFFEVYEIVEAVKQANAIKDRLNDKMRQGYLEYYGNIKDGALEYNKSITERMPVTINIIYNDGWAKNPALPLTVKLSDTVGDLKNKLISNRETFNEIDGTNYHWLQLTFKGSDITDYDGRTLASCGVKNVSPYYDKEEYTISYWYGFDPSRG